MIEQHTPDHVNCVLCVESAGGLPSMGKTNTFVIDEVQSEEAGVIRAQAQAALQRMIESVKAERDKRIHDE